VRPAAHPWQRHTAQSSRRPGIPATSRRPASRSRRTSGVHLRLATPRCRSASERFDSPSAASPHVRVLSISRDLDVLASRPLRSMADVERHRLTLAELVERGLHARRLVEEIFGPVARGDESETLIAYKTFDGAGRCHFVDPCRVLVDSPGEMLKETCA